MNNIENNPVDTLLYLKVKEFAQRAFLHQPEKGFIDLASLNGLDPNSILISFLERYTANLPDNLILVDSSRISSSIGIAGDNGGIGIRVIEFAGLQPGYAIMAFNYAKNDDLQEKATEYWLASPGKDPLKIVVESEKDNVTLRIGTVGTHWQCTSITGIVAPVEPSTSRRS